MPLGLSSSRLSPLSVPYLRLRNLRYRRSTENQVLIDRVGAGLACGGRLARCCAAASLNCLTDSLFRDGCIAKAAQRPQSRHSVTSGENYRQAALPRRSLPILPFAEIYTVIDLVLLPLAADPTCRDSGIPLYRRG